VWYRAFNRSITQAFPSSALSYLLEGFAMKEDIFSHRTLGRNESWYLCERHYFPT